MAHLGFDDTDARRGMCTTYLAAEFVREFEDWDLVGLPRLVRLNPNVPWKTRGNGAVCLRLGRGRGTPRVAGEVDGRAVLAYPRGEPAPVDDAFEARVRRVLERWSVFDEPTTHPGYALLHRQPGPQLYWRAVRGIVPLEEALAAGRGCGRVRGYKRGRGRIGALAALSWRPRGRTYEALAYREPRRWGTPREVDETSVIEVDRTFPSTFHNYDYANGRVVLAPRSPCPVLLGVRGRVPGDLPRALHALRTEPVDRWLLFETNQATDDHLVSAGPVITPGTSVTLEGCVAVSPRTLPGGHVVLAVRRNGARFRGKVVECTAYEPSKEMRRAVRSLRPGDRVRVCGAVRAAPRTINLEKLAVLDLTPGGRRALAVGWYEPAVSARRHLAKPLKHLASPPRARTG